MTSTLKGVTAQLGIGGSQTEVTDWFQQQLLAALADPLFNIPKAFETWMVDRVAVAGLNLPIGQIVGFDSFTASIDQVGPNDQGTNSATFVDLSTAGPELTTLAAGSYVVLFGASMQAPATHTMYMGVSINGAAPDDAHVCETQTSSNLSLAHAFITTLTDTSNSLVAKYRIDTGATEGFCRYRWLLAIKYANS